MFGFTPPRAIAFDIIGTVFPLEPLRSRLIALGLPSTALEGWFATALRDAFALAAAGDFAPFEKVLEAALDAVLDEQGLSPPTAERKLVLDGMKELDPRPGADEAMRLAREGGVSVLALSNGSVSSTRALLERAGMLDLVDHIVSVDAVKRSKPAPEVYRHAAVLCELRLSELALVAAHGWDVNGAAAAGLLTAYCSADRPLSPTMRKPDVEAAWLPDCVRGLLKV